MVAVAIETHFSGSYLDLHLNYDAVSQFSEHQLLRFTVDEELVAIVASHYNGAFFLSNTFKLFLVFSDDSERDWARGDLVEPEFDVLSAAIGYLIEAVYLIKLLIFYFPDD